MLSPTAKEARSSAVAVRPRNASCYSIFR